MFVVVAVVAALDPLGVGGKIETDLGILCGFSLAEGLCRFDLIGWFFFYYYFKSSKHFIDVNLPSIG